MVIRSKFALAGVAKTGAPRDRAAVGMFVLAAVTAVQPGPARSQDAQPFETAQPGPPALALPPPGWSSAEVEAEQARCSRLFQGLDIVVQRLAPLKEHECGAPAPVQLMAVGRSPAVAISPPITVTCDLAAALARWIKDDVQPLARKHLGSEIVRIDTMSSYSCRTAYGRKNTHLSEHGRANATDLRSFTTAKGVTVDVLADWGPTGREIAEQVAAAQRQQSDHSRLARTQPGSLDVTTGSVAQASGETSSGGRPSWMRPSITVGTHTTTGFGFPDSGGSAIGFSTGIGPQRLGGPKPAETAGQPAPATPSRSTTPAKNDPSFKMVFLRASHDKACTVFGTTLGPEANSAHRNHFHVDMAERSIRRICE